MDILGSACLCNWRRRYRPAKERRVRRTVCKKSNSAGLGIMESANIFIFYSMSYKDWFDEMVESCSSRTCHNTLSFQILNSLNTGWHRCNKKGNIWRQGHNRLYGVFLFPFFLPPHRKERDSRIGKGEIDFPFIQSINIFLSAFCRFRRDLPILFICMGANNLCDSTSHHKKSPSGRGSTDAQKLTFIFICTLALAGLFAATLNNHDTWGYQQNQTF